MTKQLKNCIILDIYCAQIQAFKFYFINLGIPKSMTPHFLLCSVWKRNKAK